LGFSRGLGRKGLGIIPDWKGLGRLGEEFIGLRANFGPGNFSTWDYLRNCFGKKFRTYWLD